MSTHTCPVVEVKLYPHPNADNLSLVYPFGEGGFQVIVKTDDWKHNILGVYIPPDSIVPNTEEFAFLEGKNRIKVRKFRKVYSQGLLIHLPKSIKNVQVGDDLMERMGIEAYVSPIEIQIGGDAEGGPAVIVYDIENGLHYPNIFSPDEKVIITEKIHGANSKFMFANDRMYCGSRRQWKAYSDASVWWRVLNKYPQIETLCRHNEGSILWGEVYGPVQELHYGSPQEVQFAAFDFMQGGMFLDYYIFVETMLEYNIPMVPLLAKVPYSEYKNYIEGDSLIEKADHFREGIVVKSIVEGFDLMIGRRQVKFVSNSYLEKAK